MKSLPYIYCICLSAAFFPLLEAQAINRAPKFIDGDLENLLSYVGILEDTPVGTKLGQLKAEDEDCPSCTIQFVTLSQTLRGDINGNVFLDRPLDRENTISSDDGTGETLRAIFRAYDPEVRGVFTEVKIPIKVLDVNDNVPLFVNTPYSSLVPEDTQPGTTVFSRVSVVDIDAGAYNEIELSCYHTGEPSEAKMACEKFTVETVQAGESGQYFGRIRLTGSLDFETKKEYIMSVMAKDNPTETGPKKTRLSSIANILIKVGDTQDSPPTFITSPITIVPDENTPKGTTVGVIEARDTDLGNPRRIQIDIIEGTDKDNMFSLGPSFEKGETDIYRANIIVEGAIDYEQSFLYEFQVRATELDENGQKTDATTTTRVIVDIQDQNDHVPQFDKSEYKISIPESDLSTFKNTRVPGLEMVVTDKDSPTNAKFVVEMVSNPDDVFSIPIAQFSGQAPISLIIKRPEFLDYEIPEYRTRVVSLRARQIDALNPRETTAVVTITLTDQNDNAPIFTQNTFSTNLGENTAVDTLLDINVQASDKDSLENGRITYSLEGTGANTVFRIDADTGQVYLNAPLNYELVTQYGLFIVATDNGRDPHRTYANLNVAVDNFNDQAPVFNPPSYSTTIDEGQTIGFNPPVTVQATHPETGLGDAIRYRLVDPPRNGAFILDAVTGVLSLSRPLIYNEDRTDDGDGTEIIELRVEANDNDPVTPQKQETRIYVTLRDVNDHDPQFSPQFYTRTISEAAPRDFSVVTVTASDGDYASNGKLRYQIISGHLDHFYLPNVDNGTILVSRAGQLDFDAKPRYSLQVYAIDNGSPAKTGTASVEISLTDANNKNPYFDLQIYLRSIDEGLPAATSVLTVTGSDPDAGNELRYSIPESSISARNEDGRLIETTFEFNYKDSFAVHPVSGLITTTKVLNRKDAAEYQFSVMVRDINGDTDRQTATTSILITILGSSEIPPYFVPPWTSSNPEYSRNIREGIPLGAKLHTLVAKDPMTNTKITDFEFVGNYPDADYFTLNKKTGDIFIRKEIDYEALPSARLSFTVQANADPSPTGKSRSIKALINVAVQDVNDNAPEFTTTTGYHFTIPENYEYPATVGVVNARDLDTGYFGQIEYALNGQRATDFVIHPSGIINVSPSASLDHETKDQYTLMVTAKDNPNGEQTDVRRQSTTSVRITITDYNDFAPEFDKAEYEMYTVESIPVGVGIGGVKATDKDSGTNKIIRYTLDRLEDREAAGLFEVGLNDGNIYTRRSLRGASFNSPYTLLVRASDQGFPSLESTVRVNIHVTSGQLDDGTPVISRPNIGVDLSSNLTYLGFKRRVQVLGFEDWKLLRDWQMKAAGLFEVGLNDGNIYTRRSLRGASFNSPYTLLVRASDQGFPSLESTVRVNIHVTSGQLDDGTPVISRPNIGEVVLTVCENSAAGTFVYDALATARGENSTVKYSFLTNDAARDFERFTIKPYTDPNTKRVYGRITVAENAVLDREVKDNYQVIIIAEDSNNKTLQSFRQLNIKLCDENDNIPSFFCEGKQNKFTVEMTENENNKTGRFVYQVKACDDDLPPNNKIEYTFMTGGDSCPAEHIKSFKIHPTTGVISTNKVMDREIQNEYKVCVKASIPNDQQDTQSDSNKFYLTVQLLDINDNGPSYKDFYQPGDTKLIAVIYEQPAREEILQLSVRDKDLPPYNRPRFLISSIQFFDPNDDEVTYVPGAFIVHSGTGEITVGMQSYKPFTGGYFKVNIRAEDYFKPALQETITVTIFITQPRNRVRVVLKQEAENAAEDANTLLEYFNKQSDGSYFILDSMTYHRNIDMGYDYERTDICFIILNKPGVNVEYDVLSAYKGTDLVDQPAYQEVIKKVDAVDTGPCAPETTNDFEGWTVLWWVLVAFAIFIFVCTFIFIVVICQLYRNYKEYMLTRKTYLVQE